MMDKGYTHSNINMKNFDVSIFTYDVVSQFSFFESKISDGGFTHSRNQIRKMKIKKILKNPLK